MKILRKSTNDGPGGPLYESVGATHIHTHYSDGTGATHEIADFAEQRGLQWIIITDHSHMQARDNEEHGRYGSVWVLVGTELGDTDLPNHYLSYGLPSLPDQSNPAEMVRQAQALGAFGAIAHPHEKRTAFADMPPYPWTAWDAPIDGVEIWNQLSQWVEGLTPRNRYTRFIHPLKSLTYPERETLAVWDKLNLHRPVVGYVGLDAHALKYPLLHGLVHVKVFHYKVQFRSLLTHLLLDRPLEKKRYDLADAQILEALRKGRHFGANHRVGNPFGFRFFGIVNGKRILPIDRIDPGNRIEFHAYAPIECDLRLMRNGREVIRIHGKRLRYTTEEDGVWRVEAYRKGRGWIFSNPLRVLPE